VSHLCALADQLAQLLENRPKAGRDGPAAGLEREAPKLPRATRNALDALRKTRSPRGEVALPGGLVALYDRAHADLVVTRRPSRRPNSDAGPSEARDRPRTKRR
jgi:hypothetical protein